MHAPAQLDPTLCNPLDYMLPGSYGIGCSRQEPWSGLPFPPSGDIPNYLFLIYSNFLPKIFVCLGFPGDSGSKKFTGNMGDLGSIPELERSPGGGHGNPLQYSCLENPHGQSSLVGYSPWGCKEADMTEWLSTAHLSIDHLYVYIYVHVNMYLCLYLYFYQVTCLSHKIGEAGPYFSVCCSSWSGSFFVQPFWRQERQFPLFWAKHINLYWYFKASYL